MRVLKYRMVIPKPYSRGRWPVLRVVDPANRQRKSWNGKEGEESPPFGGPTLSVHMQRGICRTGRHIIRSPLFEDSLQKGRIIEILLCMRSSASDKENKKERRNDLGGSDSGWQWLTQSKGAAEQAEVGWDGSNMGGVCVT
ncbi:hypothetical protein MLD38_036257 [Melastoma candidum]|uniref:Uncharacterized protein n=1 Tax=Melastoma candidum TaxID=119954 RepID=A0ACB9LJD7_9MYRT|nr:hypothetical protein MLD38_036257 [Melastoma candidum]